MNRLSRLLHARPYHVRFALVGGTGFIVDATAMLVLFELMQMDLAAARILAFTLAASSNWLLNRLFTFSDRTLAGRKALEWMRFVISAILSAVPNLGIFLLLMLALPATPLFIVLAMSCGILAGYFSNYRLARGWVFRSRPS